MKMINHKVIMFFLALMAFSATSFGQNSAATQDDYNRISLAAYVSPQVENLPEGAKSMLTNKLNQIATQGGMGASPINAGFIITANVVVLTKDLTATAPPMTALSLEVTLYIGDGIRGTKFASQAVTVKGVGTNENKAYIEAIKQIKPADASIQGFLKSGKTKILEYYNGQCDFIIKDAQALADQNDFGGAIYRLTSVPTVAKDCYNKAMAAVAPMYQKYMERQCKVALLQARNAWNASPNATGAAAAAEVLGTIEPDASCYKEAMQLSQEIGKKMLENDKREWNFKMKVEDDKVKIDERIIGAYRDVGMAWGNHQPQSITYNVHGWW